MDIALSIPGGMTQRSPDPQAAARAAQRPQRWQPYETEATGKITVKANAKLTPAETKKPTPNVPTPASTWPTPPADSWPPLRK